MSDHEGAARAEVSLGDIASRAPRMLADLPVIVRGTLTGMLATPNSNKSIGTVFQDRAARYGDRVFLRFGDQQLTYRDANATANRYAAVLAARGVGHGDVVAIMLRNSPNAVLAMLATVKCGAIAGMLNYHQRGDVLAHSLGLLDAKVLIAETDLVSAVTECGGTGDSETLTIEDLERFAVSAPATNPATASAVQARDTAFYIFTSGTTGFPKASVMTHLRWLKALAAFGGLGLRLKSSDTLYCCLPLYHNNALTVALSSVINSGATLALGKSFSASKFWDDVIASRGHRIHLYRRDLPVSAEPAAEADGSHAQGAHDRRQRVATGDLGRVHQTLRHRASVRVLRLQRRQHRVHQRLQCAREHRHLTDAAGLRGIRSRHRRPAA